MRGAILALGGALILGGCGGAVAPDPAPGTALTLSRALMERAPEGGPGCPAEVQIRPASFGTVMRAVELRPARIDPKTGKELEPAVYEERPFSAVVDPGEVKYFETLCREQATPELVANLQRALKARGLYRGAITRRLDAGTRAAIRAYQAPRGLPSDEISRRALMEMGLLVWED
ncbi:peptidoglycan-binding domain-containing protein [Pseudothioclava arenosa]|nr:peptidoglycan-binding domain-containing protein [Pseudothioclava arenosa]